MRPVLSVQNLDVNFGDHPILKDINFDVFPNQILVLMGPGGGGKSTLLRTICALNAAQKNASFPGSILYKNNPITPDNAPVMVVQKARLLLETVFENLREQHPRRSTLSMLEQRQEFIRFLQEIGLDELADKLDTPVLELTKVQRKQVMLSGVLLENPALLCLDEPTADLDQDEANEFLQFIRTISNRHATIVVTHNQRHARAIGDYIGLIAGGRLQEFRLLDEFYANPQTQAAHDYIRTGGCSVPSLTAKPVDLEPDYEQIDIEIALMSDGPTTETGMFTESYLSSSEKIPPFGWIRPHSTTNTSKHHAHQKLQVADTDNTPDIDILTVFKAIYLDEDFE